MKLSLLLLLLAVLSTGFMAGIFFTWTNAVTPGIGKLNSLEYLKALQAMNRVILNPLFYIAFLAPIAMLLLSIAFNYVTAPPNIFRLILSAGILYFIGTFLVTILGNIPLNNILDQSHLEILSPDVLDELRIQIEQPWNQLNLYRTWSSFSSFILLLIATFLWLK